MIGGNQDSNSQSPDNTVERAYDLFCEAWFTGNHLDPEEFCMQYPEYGQLLLDRIHNFILVAKGLPDAVSPPMEQLPIKDQNNLILGDYRIIRKIGQGGMATVYEAEQRSLNRKVALKVLPPHLSLNDISVLKFHREALATGRQSHPGIISIYGVGEEDGKHYIVQELVEDGFNLADYLNSLRKEKAPPLGYFRQITSILNEVANAITHTHEHRIIHRDIKPSNILLTRDLKPKVTDFGLARIEDALALSRTGDLSGTPYYMSPEQALGRRDKIDHRTDIYSLGVTLYEALTLVRPFEGDSSPDVLKKIISSEPADPQKVNPRTPRDLAVICLKAMEKDPNHRYASMNEMAEDLNRYLQGEVILAKPSGLLKRFTKRVKRNKALFAASSLAVIGVIWILGSIPWYIITINSKKKEALFQKEIAEKEADNAKWLNDFILELFSAPTPRKMGKETKVIDLLNSKVGMLVNAPADKFEGIAQIRNRIALLFIELTFYEKAKALLKEWVKANKKELGDKHPVTIRSMNNLGLCLLNTKKHKDAEKLFSEVLSLAKETLPPGDPKIYVAIDNLAHSLFWQAKYQECDALYLEAYEIKRRHLGDKNKDTQRSLGYMANSLHKQGAFKEAEKRYGELLAMMLEVYEDKEDLDLIAIEMSLALTIRDQGRPKEALPILQKCYEIQTRKAGKDHNDSLVMQCELADALYLSRSIKASMEQYQDLLNTVHKRQGKELKVTTVAQEKLANIYCVIGKPDQAEPLLKDALKTHLKDYGENSQRTIDTMGNLGVALLCQKKHKEAEGHLNKAIALQKALSGEDHKNVLLNQYRLAHVFNGLKMPQETEKLLEETLQSQRKILGQCAGDTLNTLAGLVSFLINSSQYDKARLLTKDWMDVIEKQLPQGHPIRKQILENYAKALVHGFSKDQTQPELQAALKGCIKAPTTLDMLRSLAAHYNELGKKELAKIYQDMIRNTK